LVHDAEPSLELRGRGGELVGVMVGRSAQGRPGEAGARGELAVVEVGAEADELSAHGAALQVEAAQLPQPQQRRLEGLSRQERGRPGPEPGRRRVGSLQKTVRHAQDVLPLGAHGWPRSQATSLLARRTRSTAAAGSIGPPSSQRLKVSARSRASFSSRGRTSAARSAEAKRARAASRGGGAAPGRAFSTSGWAWGGGGRGRLAGSMQVAWRASRQRPGTTRAAAEDSSAVPATARASSR